MQTPLLKEDKNFFGLFFNGLKPNFKAGVLERFLIFFLLFLINWLIVGIVVISEYRICANLRIIESAIRLFVMNWLFVDLFQKEKTYFMTAVEFDSHFFILRNIK